MSGPVSREDVRRSTGATQAHGRTLVRLGDLHQGLDVLESADQGQLPSPFRAITDALARKKFKTRIWGQFVRHGVSLTGRSLVGSSGRGKGV